MYTFHWGNSKIYVITHFKFQGTAPRVGVALLTKLGSQDVCTDLLHFLFCLCHNVGTKDNPFCLTWTNSVECSRVIPRVLWKVTSWCSLDNCCYMRTQLVEGAYPTSYHHSECKHEAYLWWFDWLAQAIRQSEDDRLSFRWDVCPNIHVVVPKYVPQR
jgi:hypothetical protein